MTTITSMIPMTWSIAVTTANNTDNDKIDIFMRNSRSCQTFGATTIADKLGNYLSGRATRIPESLRYFFR
jgi:hypothetical protein